jgi:acetylornithine deacetylase
MTAREAVRAQVERSWDDEVAFLSDLVRQRSTLGNEAGVQARVADELEAMGLPVDAWDVDRDAIAGRPGFSPVEWSYEGRPDVAAVWRTESPGGRSLILNGHIDVVPATPESHWTRAPWGAEIADGRMWGRGAADMKAGVAAMIYAVYALREAGVELRGDVTLQTVIEEECTGNGALATLARGYGADAAIIPEPFGERGLAAQVGVLWSRVTVRGQGAHAERADQAQNAIVKAARVIEAVQALEAEANARERPPAFASIPHPLNYNVGVVRGGDWASSVPEECELEVRLSAYPGEDLDAVQTRFREGILERTREDPWLAEHPPEVAFYAFRAEGCEVDSGAPLLDSLRGAHQAVLGAPLETFAFTGTTDMRFFNLYAGTPATCYGPLGGNLHAPDEWVDLESVKATTLVLAHAAADWCR